MPHPDETDVGVHHRKERAQAHTFARSAYNVYKGAVFTEQTRVEAFLGGSSMDSHLVKRNKPLERGILQERAAA